MFKHKNLIGLAAMVVAAVPMGVSALAAEKENMDVSTAPAKAAVCDYRIVTANTVDSNVTLPELKRDKDGSYYTIMPDGTKITVTMTEPESGVDENAEIRFVCE